MGTSQSMRTKQTPNGPNQDHVEDQAPSMPLDETPYGSVQGYLQDTSDYPPLSTQIDQTPYESVQGSPTDQTPYESVQGSPPYESVQGSPTDQTPYESVQGSPTDQTPYESVQGSPTDQTPNESIQGFLHDNFYYPPLNTPIDQTPNRPVQGYMQDPFSRTSDRNRSCFSCYTHEYWHPIEVEYTNLGDGRYQCPNCLPISLMEPSQLKPIIHQVRNFFHDHLKLPIKKEIPIFFVDANEIKKDSKDQVSDNRVIHGATLLGGSHAIKIVKKCVRRGADIEAVTKMKKVNSDKVPTILLLFGPPKPVVGATLAHEMMHAWIHLQGWTFTLEWSVEESICDVVASMWLDYTADEYDPSYTENNASFAKKLSSCHRHLLETFSVGGAEFLKAKYAVEKYGLKHTLDSVACTRNIPE